ncbi:hypothetical protein COY28_00795 [Candidatus Woesearchaeota archaeon CG_4_10_14_0_2_um_filter_57_5]|nr:MAG: hypothetical protein COV94_04320 [Candidatus Woesearchaeota archaeon CG11_big_fil_rev_8_21_14_0_20_57_5]PIZ56685.1 MAG: hypothetical protein COY28_00795 [Candidatus Woesearchaeota archaeon CG_4_10_14_0_2_um_filter_57_5]
MPTIALINCAKGLTDMVLTPAQQNIGLVVIKQALESAGIDVLMLPEEPVDFSSENLDEGIRAMYFPIFERSHDIAYVGMSVMSETMWLMNMHAQTLRHIVPEIPLAAGGAAFRRELSLERKGLRDPVHWTLEEGIVDLVNVGHAASFVQLCKTCDRDLPGIYHWDDGLQGSGTSGIPELDRLPIGMGESDSIRVVLRDVCGNACDYCVTYSGGFAIDPSIAVRDLRAHLDTHPEHTRLVVSDSNPFANWSYYDDILTGLQGRNQHTTTYLEPTNYAHSPELHHTAIRKHRLDRMFIGRDTVYETDAAFMGRRYQGKSKTQAMLDTEAVALKELVKFLKAEDRPTQLQIHYILSPSLTPEHGIALVDEMMEMDALGNDTVDVSIGVFPLLPHPGTRLRREHIEHIIGPEDYLSFRGYDIRWRDSLPGSACIEVIGRARPVDMNFQERYTAARAELAGMRAAGTYRES